MLAVLGVVSVTAARADGPVPYTVEVSDVTAKVGAPAVLLAKLHLRDGMQFLHAYNNRVSQFSAFDDGVVFETKMVPGDEQDGTMVFAITVRSTKPGSHAINGVIRVGYIESSNEMAMVSVPLMAKVVGTE